MICVRERGSVTVTLQLTATLSLANLGEVTSANVHGTL